MDQTAYFEQMRQKRRAEILAEARQMILAEGPMTFTMQNLSKRLDISNVTLYKYFKTAKISFEPYIWKPRRIWRIQRLPYLGGNTAGSLSAEYPVFSR